MKSTEILNSLQVSLTINRLCFQLIENHNDFSNSVLIGLQPNGIFLANRLKKSLQNSIKNKVSVGSLDITFFRDDFRRKEKPLIPSVTNIDFSIENKKVILVDDSWRYPKIRKISNAKKVIRFESIGPCRQGITTTDLHFY